MTREEAIRAMQFYKEKLYNGIFNQYIDAFDMAITALRQQECVGDVNKSLTMDELRQMDGEPVWVVYDEDAGMWALVEVCEESIFLTNNLGGRTEYAADVELEDDGITVYRQKPKEIQK